MKNLHNEWHILKGLSMNNVIAWTHITGSLCRESTTTGGFPAQRASNAELWCFMSFFMFHELLAWTNSSTKSWVASDLRLNHTHVTSLWGKECHLPVSPVQHGITPPQPPCRHIQWQTIHPAQLMCSYVGNIGTIAQGSANTSILSPCSQPFRPKYQAVNK